MKIYLMLEPTFCDKCKADAEWILKRDESVPDDYFEDEDGNLQMRLKVETTTVTVCPAHLDTYLYKSFEIYGKFAQVLSR